VAAAGFSWATRSIAFIKKHIRAINLFGGAVLIALGLLLLTGFWQNFIDYISEVTRVFTPTL
jgi:cytochrome c-type biogenesis protein